MDGEDPDALQLGKAHAFGGSPSPALASRFKNSRTCVAGVVCNVDGIYGMSLTATDHFAVLETCGTDSSATIDKISLFLNFEELL